MARQTPPQRTWDDYFIPGTTVLRNKFVGPNEPYGVCDIEAFRPGNLLRDEFVHVRRWRNWSLGFATIRLGIPTGRHYPSCSLNGSSTRGHPSSQSDYRTAKLPVRYVSIEF